ncbi:type 2 periplasmic-binding domain-containing protein [Pseudomonas atacamensis]|uniref:hypothetical protein n=1 Tax=Pseudomonas atacamensis TaxID=2565368 RepID=UPI001CEC27FD|nr:hypothetical protein [Pseudomonas atacamensis]
MKCSFAKGGDVVDGAGLLVLILNCGARNSIFKRLRKTPFHPHLKVTAHVAAWREVANQVASGAVDLGIAEISALHGREDLTCELLGEHQG